MTERFEIRVSGLKELNMAFKQLSDEIAGPGLKAAFLAIATTVAGKARQMVPSRSGTAAASIQAHGSTRGATLSFGGQAAPYMPWLDFGGSVGRGHVHGVGFSGAIKRDWMGRPAGEGRYVYPAISAERDHTAEAVEAAIAEAAHKMEFDIR